MTLILALRLFNKSHARDGIEHRSKSRTQRGRLVDLGVDRLYPVLRNAVAYLVREGFLLPIREGQVLRKESDGSTTVDRQAECRLYWCEIETELPLSFWLSCQEVELALPKADIERWAASIRSRAGASYIEACEDFARSLTVQALPICYLPPVPSKAEAA